ncbi:MAG TPA: ATP synthase F1 subunit delta [Bryobacteraceae bacterium]|nr:ATP synthase F1 subunit delta [Bryobacteraceae bacterium]
MISVAAHRYAEALADIVFTPGAGRKPEQALEQLAAFESAMDEFPELKHVMITPAVPSARKRAVVADLARPLGLSPLMRNFLFVLVDRHRIGEIAEVREALRQVMDERMGFVRADITSAQPLDEKQTADLEEELGRLTGKKIRANFTVDPTLIGGVSARVGSRRYDGSVRGQLENMRQKLAARS